MGMNATGDTTPMPHVATSPTDLLAALSGAAHLDGERLVIDDEAAFRDTGIRDLAWTAAFSDDDATTAAAQWLVWEASQELGARSASIQALYEARARGEVSGFTVPAHQPADPGLRHGTDRLRGRRGRRRRRRSSWNSPAASRPTRSSVRSTTRPRSWPARSPRAGTGRSSSRATTTSSTPRSTPPTPRR